MTEERRIRVGDIEVAYEEHGRGARPFVLVHGFTGSRDDWREVLPALAERGRSLAPDLRGHGGSSNPGDPAAYGFEPLVADLAGFLDSVDAPRCDLLGHSLGGMLALRFALAFPERVRSLVLMDTSPYPNRGEMRPIFEAGAKLAREAGMQALFEIARRQPAGGPEPSARYTIEALGEEQHWQRIETKLLAMDPEAFAALGALLLDHESVEARLAELTMPTLVLVGAEDAAFREASERLAAGIPGARRVEIPRAGHSPQLDNTAAWLEAVLAHLDAVRAG